MSVTTFVLLLFLIAIAMKLWFLRDLLCENIEFPRVKQISSTLMKESTHLCIANRGWSDSVKCNPQVEIPPASAARSKRFKFVIAITSVARFSGQHLPQNKPPPDH